MQRTFQNGTYALGPGYMQATGVPFLVQPALRKDLPIDPLVPARVDPTDRCFSFCFPGRSDWWCPSYIVDYIIAVILAVAAIIMFALWDPTLRAYQLSARDAAGNFVFNDNTNTNPLLDDTFEVWVTALISIVAPVLIALAYTVFRWFGPAMETSLHDIHHFILGMGLAVALAFFTFFFINRGVGGLRPDFAARLETGDADLIEEGRESFPSGHTTGAFVGLVFFALWASGKLRVFHSSRGNLWRFALAVMAPLALAIAQAITRITDNRHSPIDVVTGALLGSVAAACGYYLHYPSLHAPDCDLPKNRRRAYLAHLFSGIPTPLPT